MRPLVGLESPLFFLRSLVGDNSLRWVQKAGGLGRVRQGKQQNNTPQGSKDAQDNEQPLFRLAHAIDQSQARTLQGARGPVVMYEHPYEIRAPQNPPTELPRNQTPWRAACSEGLYHMLVMSENPGLIVLSKAPSSTRTMQRPTKFCVAP